VLVRRENKRSIRIVGHASTARKTPHTALLSVAGATLGAGVYVLTGTIGSTTGPATIICFFISGLASVLSGICYAEFGARVPRAGSAYVYSFVTVGEAIAWTTGWQLLLEYIIGASTVARSWSGYLDSLSGGAISAFMSSHIPPMNVTGLAQEVDFLAFGITMLLTCVCAFGAKESSMVNNLLTGTNVLVILFTIIVSDFRYTLVQLTLWHRFYRRFSCRREHSTPTQRSMSPLRLSRT
jgi:amino acid transporter